MSRNMKLVCLAALIIVAPMIFSVGVKAESRFIRYKDWVYRPFAISKWSDVTGKMLCDFSHYLWWLKVFMPHEEAPLSCKEEAWRPMVGWLSKLYMPFIANNATDVQETLKKMTPLIHVCWWEQEPNLLVPTVETTMTADQLNTRKWYFGTNYIALLFCFAVFLEVLLKLWPKTSKIMKKMVNEMYEFLLITWPETSKMMKKKVKETYELMRDMYAWMMNSLPENPHTAQLLEHEREHEQENVQILRVPSFPIAFKSWYILFQMCVWINTDMAVYGGMINTTTGTAWEGYAPLVLFELVTHLTCACVRYVHTGGENEQHPSLLIFPCLLPWLGSSLHIWKDHMFTGLCFSVAHCSNGQTKNAALILGYLGIAINIVSVIALFREEIVLQGLRAAHWPILEASRTTGISMSFFTLQSRKKEALTTAIGMCTVEKEKRAYYAELPHTVLHVVFLYMFGGSPFVYASIALSGTKLVLIPCLRRYLLSSPKMMLEIGCSVDAMRKLWLNVFRQKDNDYQTFWKLAWKNGQVVVLEDLLSPQVSDLRRTKELDLNSILLQDCGPVAACLAHFPEIRKVNLTDNIIEDITALASALKENTVLQELCLASNKIKDITALASALNTNKTLKVLRLAYN